MHRCSSLRDDGVWLKLSGSGQPGLMTPENEKRRGPGRPWPGPQR